jgi:hypothetical protein
MVIKMHDDDRVRRNFDIINLRILVEEELSRRFSQQNYRLTSCGTQTHGSSAEQKVHLSARIEISRPDRTYSWEWVISAPTPRPGSTFVI